MQPQYPVTFVSLGPGEAELITLKGLKALQAAHCIFCPETTTPTGHRTSRAADIMHQLGITLQRENKNVCIVAEGDAGFYSSIHYIYEKLQADGLPVKHVAGIPAFIAAGARAGLHIANQEERMTVIPGTATAEDIVKLMQEKVVTIIMKLSQCAEEMQRCMKWHPEYSYHYFENIGTDKEIYLNDVQQIKKLHFPYFSLLIVRNDKF